MPRKRIVILGASSSGYATALALKDRVGAQHDVTVIARSDQFVFVPSLPRLVVGERSVAQTAFSVAPRFAQRGIAFRAEPALRIDFARRRVVTRAKEERYDWLVLATGARPNYAAVPGLGPRGYTHSVTTLTQAEVARAALAAYRARPTGPAVIGDVQGSMGRSQGLWLAHAIARLGGDVTHLTSGPAVASGAVPSIAGAVVTEVVPGKIHLRDGRALPFGFSILLPPFLGVDLIRALPQLTDAAGFVRVNSFLQTLPHPDVFAVGSAVAGTDEDRCGPRTEARAQCVAANIAAAIAGQPLQADVEAGPSADDWEHVAWNRYFGP